jgi:hypothetical protein
MAARRNRETSATRATTVERSYNGIRIQQPVEIEKMRAEAGTWCLI